MKNKLLILAILVGFHLNISQAHAASCEDLWVARNSIFNNNGYCFKSNLGKALFNNGDCYTSNAQLSSDERSQVQRIKSEEKRRGCSVNTAASYLNGYGNSQQNYSKNYTPQYNAPAPKSNLHMHTCKFKCIGNSGGTNQYEAIVSVKIKAESSYDAMSYIDTYDLCRSQGYDRTPYMGDALSCRP